MTSRGRRPIPTRRRRGHGLGTAVTIPRTLPQITPHRLTAIESTIRPAPSGTADRRPTAPGRSMPERDEDERERHEVVAEAVAELDPALAEVHEVDERDQRGSRGRPRSRGGAAPAPQDRRDREEVGRAREEQAHPGVARHGEGAVGVEQAADRARDGAQDLAVAEAGGKTSGRIAGVLNSMIQRFCGM